MTLASFVRANLLGGLFGTLVLSPIAYILEFMQNGVESRLVKVDFVDLSMLLAVPILSGFAFAISALAAFPIVNWLQKKGLVRFDE